MDRDATVEGKSKDILLSLLDYHPRAAAKKGVGVQTITYGEHPEYKGTQCFMINRTDGTIEDFSFRKCIQAVFPEDEDQKKKNSGGKKFEKKRGRGGNDGGNDGAGGAGGSSSSSSSSSPNKKQRVSGALEQDKTGVLVHVKNLPIGTRWSDLKKEIEMYGAVTYVHHIERGSTETIVQMSMAEDVSKVVNGLKEMDGKELELAALTEVKEKEFYAAQVKAEN